MLKCFHFLHVVYKISKAQINNNVLKYLCAPLEAGSKDEVPAGCGDHGKRAWGLNIDLFEALKHLVLCIPQVDL